MNTEERTRQPNAMFPMHPKMDEQLAQAFSANEDEEEKHIQKVQNAFLYYG